MNVDFGSFATTDGVLSPKDIMTGSLALPIKEESDTTNIALASTVALPAMERNTEVLSSSSASNSVNREFLKQKVQSPPRGDGAKISGLCSFLTEGLTEFAPWTGFDYNSDDGEDEEEDDDGGPNKKRKRPN
jgi:hypothetical protein